MRTSYKSHTRSCTIQYNTLNTIKLAINKFLYIYIYTTNYALIQKKNYKYCTFNIHYTIRNYYIYIKKNINSMSYHKNYLTRHNYDLFDLNLIIRVMSQNIICVKFKKSETVKNLL